jgi:hypothetical protein
VAAADARNRRITGHISIYSIIYLMRIIASGWGSELLFQAGTLLLGQRWKGISGSRFRGAERIPPTPRYEVIP